MPRSLLAKFGESWGGVVERAAARSVFLAGNIASDKRGAVGTTHLLLKDTYSLFKDKEQACIILHPLGNDTLPWS